MAKKARSPIWMPHPAHFYGAYECDFRLATYLPETRLIVSTVGEFNFQKDPGREEGAHRVGPVVFESHPLNRGGATYQTMVFKAVKYPSKCCPYVVRDFSPLFELDCKSADEATAGHYRLIAKYSKVGPRKTK